MFDQDYEGFVSAYPGYARTAAIDELRGRDYSRLDGQKQVYLDYTGAGLYGESQLKRHLDLLSSGVYGNPHSTNPSSKAATVLVEGARARVLEYLNASAEEYVVVFTENASGALKLVGESYPFGRPGEKAGRFLLTFDNHNSVNGIREFARTRGADVVYVPVELPDLRVPESRIEAELGSRPAAGSSLFAFPAQSNFSSVRHPLEWIAKAKAEGWDVLLDAAAYAPTNVLDLALHKPDFVTLSFYKMFGYPTGIGALVARREALSRLRRPWFAGGTITVASVQGDRYYLSEGAAGFEDGTVDFLGLPAVAIGLDHLAGIGVGLIHERVEALTGWLLGRLTSMRHASGRPLVRVYGPLDMNNRGGAIALNFADSAGAPIDHRLIEAEANARGISLRTGCFCNPGAGEIALGISRDELATCFTSPEHAKRLTIDDFRDCIDGKSTGAVRISLGIASDFKDVSAFLAFAEGFLDR
ncbi:MAG: aminotransferase class V-fold PLP-dependent enzyme [Rectinemataceae bacterium]|jgi:selenocysteine lyase/cysteine desulfurase